MGDEVLYLKDSPNVKIPYIEQWVEIVAANVHVKMGDLSLKDTLQEIKKDTIGYPRCMSKHALMHVDVKTYKKQHR